MRIVKYMMVAGERENGVFEENVQEAIEAGWQPYGNPMIETVHLEQGGQDIVFWQAVVMYEPT